MFPNATNSGFRLLRLMACGLLLTMAGLGSMNAGAQLTSLSDAPIRSTSSVPANIMLALSVEWPTGNTQAYHDAGGTPCPGRDSNGDSVCYYPVNTYLGYFDPYKCYAYSTTNNFFYPVAYTTGASALAPTSGDHSCSGNWSGNFMNWAAMHVIDGFRWTMTGGDRYTDTATLTVLEKARHDGQGGTAQFPYKRIGGADVGTLPNYVNPVMPSTVTPYTWGQLFLRVQSLNTVMWVSKARAGITQNHPTSTTNVNNTLDVPAPSVQTYTEEGLCAGYTPPSGATCTQISTVSTGTMQITEQQTTTNEAGQCPVAGSVSCMNTAGPTPGTMQYQYTQQASGITCPSTDVNQTACTQTSIGVRAPVLREAGQCPPPAAPSGTTYSACTNTITGTSTVTRNETGTCATVTNPSGTTFVSCSDTGAGTRSYTLTESGQCPGPAAPSGKTYGTCSNTTSPTRQVTYTETNLLCPVSGSVSCTQTTAGTVTVVYKESGSCPPGTTPSGYVSCASAGGGNRNVTVTRTGICASYTPVLSGSQTQQSCAQTVAAVRTVVMNETGTCPRGTVSGQTNVSCTATGAGTRSYTVTEGGQCPAGTPPSGTVYGTCTNATSPTRQVVRTETGNCAAVTSGYATCAVATAGTRTYTSTEPGQCTRPPVSGVTVVTCTNTASPIITVTAQSSGQCPATLPSGTTLVAGSCTNLTAPTTGTRTVVRNVTYSSAGQCSSYTGTGTCVNTSDPLPTGLRQIAGATVDVIPFYVRVKVCDPAFPETQSSCTLYGTSTYKPEGIIQANYRRMRFGAFAYLLDGNQQRDGGVLRARMKDVGPVKTVPGAAAVTNSRAEWSSTDGTYIVNPDTADTTATNSATTGAGVTKSGVIMYLNKFGRAAGYKNSDPFTEMNAEIIKYLKHYSTFSGSTPGSVAGPTNGYTSSLNASMVDGFPVITDWTTEDPWQYSCQKSFVVGLADANTWMGKNLSGGISGTATTTNQGEPALPSNVDTGYNITTWTDAVGNAESPAISNLSTFRNCCNDAPFLAGLAYFAHTSDLRPDLSDLNGKQNLTYYMVDVREAGSWGTPGFNGYGAGTGDPRNQLWLSAKFGGFKDTNNNGALDSTDLWADSAQGSVQGQAVPKNYFQGNQPDKLQTGLTQAFNDISAIIGSGAGAGLSATNVSQTNVSSGIYKVLYNTGDWTGDVQGLKVNAVDTSTGTISTSIAFDTQAVLDAQAASNGWDTGRFIVTAVPGASPLGKAFRLGNLSATQLATFGATSSDQQKVLNYLRGDRSLETNLPNGAINPGGIYRPRTHILGDIVDSEAVYVQAPNKGLSEATNPGYTDFQSTYASRPPRVYVGANDGMLHVIDGQLNSNGGDETWAFIPSALYNGPTSPAVDGLLSLTNPVFYHSYYVNSTPTVGDVDFNVTDGSAGLANPTAASADWRTILVGGLGKGGKSYYALDITDPASVTSEATAASKVLWEFSDQDMGFTYGLPVITRTQKWGWVVLVTSGYNNVTGATTANRGKGFLYVLNAKTGALLQKIATTAGSATAPSGFTMVDAFMPSLGDFLVDMVYGGDLQGNLWRFDFSSATSNVPAPTLLATIVDKNNKPQPITTQPYVSVNLSDNRRYIVIGTGRFLDTSDTATTSPSASPVQPIFNSVYAIRDGTRAVPFTTSGTLPLPTGGSFPVTRSQLVNVADLTVGILPSQISGTTPMGWYYDLPGVVTTTNSSTATTSIAAERISINPEVASGFVLFTSNLPQTDTCNPNGVSNTYVISLGTARSVIGTTDASGNFTRRAYNQSESAVKTQLVTFGDGASASLGVLLTGASGNILSPATGLNYTGSGRLLNWREVIPE